MDNKIPFWKRRELQGLALSILAFTPELLQIFPDHTVAFKLAIPVGLILSGIGLRKGYRANNLQLPGGLGDISNAIDRLPNTIKKPIFGERDI